MPAAPPGPTTPDPTVKPNASCLLTELGDGTGVLLDLATKFYFTLNETGVFLWKTLVSHGTATGGTLATALVTEFEVDTETARVDVAAVLDELVRAGLCSRSG